MSDKLTFNDDPQTIDGPTVMAYTNGYFTSSRNLEIHCIHGSSQVVTKNGLKKIKEITKDDYVLSGPKLDTFVQVKGISSCWLGPSKENIHDAIVFEKDSLGNMEPLERFIVDIDHPVGTMKDYLEGKKLRPAKEYLGTPGVFRAKWNNFVVQNEPSKRYDLILPKGYDVYIAHGIVVKARNE
ncbi:MAG: hypothetical protein QW350_05465 [Candidatus Aenigmatarchaeota archaeon]